MIFGVFILVLVYNGDIRKILIGIYFIKYVIMIILNCLGFLEIYFFKEEFIKVED